MLQHTNNYCHVIFIKKSIHGDSKSQITICMLASSMANYLSFIWSTYPAKFKRTQLESSETAMLT